MLVRAVLAAAGCAALVATSAVSAEAAGTIQLGSIQYDATGMDRASNGSVNGEYVVIRNVGRTARSLTGWTLRDADKNVYTFGTFTLGAGRSVVVRTGKGTSTRTTRYWGSGDHVWNNTGDRAYLRNAAGKGVDYCGWTSNRTGYQSC